MPFTLVNPQSMPFKVSFKTGAIMLLTGAAYTLTQVRYYVNWSVNNPPNLPEPEENNETTALPRRHLLHNSNNSVWIANPFPNQIIDLSKRYTFNFGPVFGGDYWTTEAIGFPDGFEASYGLISTSPISADKFVIKNDTMYVISEGNLKIYNVSDKRNIRLLGIYDTQGQSSSIVVDNKKKGYLIAKDLKILDLTEPNNIKLLGTFSITPDINNFTYNAAVALADDRSDIVFVKDAVDVLVINTSNPSPEVLGKFTFITPDYTYNFAEMVYKHSNLLVTHIYGLYSLDVTDLTNPTQSSLTYTQGCFGVTVSDDKAYMPCGYNGLLTLDVTDLKYPQILDNYNVGEYGKNFLTYHVAVKGNRAFLSAAYNGVWKVLDLSMSSPQELSSNWLFNFRGGQWIDVSDNAVFVADGDRLNVYDLHNLTYTGILHSDDKFENEDTYVTIMALDKEGNVEAINYFNLDVKVPPKLAVTTLTDQRIFPPQNFSLSFNIEDVYESRDPHVLSLSLHPMGKNSLPPWISMKQKMQWVGEYPRNKPTTGNHNHVTLAPTSAIISYEDSGIEVIDLTNVEHPQYLSRFPYSTRGVGILDYVAITQSNGTLFFVDMHNLLLPEIIATYPNPSGEMVSSGNALVTSDTQNLYFFDVSNYSDPDLVNSIPSSHNAMTILGPILYSANQSGLYFWNISNLTNLQLLSYTYGFYNPKQLLVYNNVLFVADWHSGSLKIFNVSDPKNPQFVSSYLAGEIQGLSIYKNRIFLATGLGGLKVLDIQNLSEPRLSSTYEGNVKEVKAYTAHSIGLIDKDKGFQIVNLTTTWEITANPGLQDTGDYELVLKASDPLGQFVTTPFTIRVEDPQYPSRAPSESPTQSLLPETSVENNQFNFTTALQYGGEFLSILLAIYVCYHYRARAWGAIKGYNKSTQSIEPGKSFSFQLSTPRDEIGSIHLMLPLSPRKGSCSRFFRSCQNLTAKKPNFMTLPSEAWPTWLKYDLDSNTLSSRGQVPEGIYYSEFLFQVKSQAGFIREELVLELDKSKLEIVYEVGHSESKSDGERTTIELETVNLGENEGDTETQIRRLSNVSTRGQFSISNKVSPEYALCPTNAPR